MNIWLLPSIVWCLLFSMALCLMYGFVYSKLRRKYVLIWLAAWVVFVLRFAFDLLNSIYDGYPIFQRCGWYSGFVCSVLLLYGVKVFLKKKIELYWMISLIIVVSIDVYCLLTGTFKDISSVGLLFYIGLIQFYSGVLFIQSRELLGARFFAAVPLIIWGMHKLDYPFLRFVPWRNLWGTLIGSFCGILTALGILILLLEEVARLARQEEVRYKRLVENAKDAVILTDINGVIVDVNQAACTALGYERKELHQLTISDIDRDIDRAEFSAFWSAVEPEKARSFEAVHWKKEGTPFDVEIKVCRFDEANVPYLLGIVRDITERKRHERELALHDKRLTSLIHILQRQVTSVQELLDGALEEAIGFTTSKLGYIYHYDDEKREFILNSWSKNVMQHCTMQPLQTCYLLDDTGAWGEAVRQEKPIIINEFQKDSPLKKGYPDGHARIDSFMTIPLLKNGRVHAVIGLANKEDGYNTTDVYHVTLLMDSVMKAVDRQEAEFLLKEREAQLKSLSDNLSNGFVYRLDTGVDGRQRRFSYISAGVERLHGLTVSQVLADSELLYGQILAEDRLLLRRQEEAAFAGMHDFKMQVRMRLPSGDVSWRHLASAPRVLPNGHIVWDGVEIDIDDLFKSKEAAEAASKAKSVFLANMSHEIRTPLHGILGMLQLLETTPLSHEQQEYLVAAARSTNRLTRLLSDILDISRIEAGKMRCSETEFTLDDLRDSILECFLAVAKGKHLDLQCDIEARLSQKLLGDEVHIRQILFNLVGNAIKFTDAGSVQVTIALLATGDDPSLHLFCTVADTGIGIADGQITTIFEPFAQIEESFARRFQGAGLGLSIASNLVKLLGGELAVDNSPGAGTTMYVSLPVRRTCAVAAPLPPARDEAATAGPVRSVLLVDDEPIGLLVGRHVLEQAGCRVSTATDGRQALALLAAGDFDCIFMDVQMPVMDGVAATRAIRHSRELGPKSGIPIIAMTAYAMAGDRERFLAAGMDGYLEKPVQVQALRDALRLCPVGRGKRHPG